MCSMSKTGVVDWEFGGDHCSRLAGEFRAEARAVASVLLVIFSGCGSCDRGCDARGEKVRSNRKLQS
jgi:hypothetical protein